MCPIALDLRVYFFRVDSGYATKDILSGSFKGARACRLRGASRRVSIREDYSSLARHDITLPVSSNEALLITTYSWTPHEASSSAPNDF